MQVRVPTAVTPYEHTGVGEQVQRDCIRKARNVWVEAGRNAGSFQDRSCVAEGARTLAVAGGRSAEGVAAHFGRNCS